MKFTYTALNNNHQKVEGVLESGTLEAAQEELHKMELSIVALKAISEEDYQKKQTTQSAEGSVTTFVFRALDPHGKTAEGTIDAGSDYAALQRLLTEYHFDVEKLEAVNAAEDVKKNSDIRLKNLKETLRLEGVELKSPVTAELKTESAPQLPPEVTKEIEGIIKAAKTVITDYQDLFTPERFGEIQKALQELEQIRTSNNLHHIAEVSRRLFELIQRPDHAEQKERGESYDQWLSHLPQGRWIKKERGMLEPEFNLKSFKRLLGKIKDRLKGKKAVPSLASESLEGYETGIKKIGKAFWACLKAPNEAAKKARQEALKQAWKEWRLSSKPSRDFGPLFFELDHFLAWLLFFYLIYFYGVDFTLEKGVGLPSGFVLKTLRSPLLLNLTIFLVVSHLLLKIKNRAFYQNGLGSLFLFFFGYGLLTILIFNF